MNLISVIKRVQWITWRYQSWSSLFGHIAIVLLAVFLVNFVVCVALNNWHDGRSSSPILKVGYSLFILAVALAIVTHAHRQLIRKWNRRALLIGLLYVVAGGLVFHTIWVWLFV